MKSKHTLKQVAFLFAAIMSLAFYAQAIKPAPKSPPPAIASAFARDYPGAKVLNWSAEKNNGVLCYEVESMDGTTRRDLIYTSEGKALEIEESVAPADLPRPVALAISRAYPKGEVKSAEKLTRGSFSGYEVTVGEGKKTHELSLDAAGNLQKAPRSGSGKN